MILGKVLVVYLLGLSAFSLEVRGIGFCRENGVIDIFWFKFLRHVAQDQISQVKFANVGQVVLQSLVWLV